MGEYNLDVGLKMSLVINDDNDNKIVLTLIGWDAQNFLLAKSMLLKNIRLTSNDDCVIRYVKDGVAYGFKTNMLSMQFSPAPMIFFKYPEDIKSMPFRKSKRVKTNIPARMLKRVGANQFSTIEAKIMDLSETGCLVEVPSNNFTNNLDKNDGFFVNFLIFEKSIEVDCIIKNVRQKDDTVLFGSEFVSIGASVREAIASFINMIDSHAAIET